MREGSQRRGFEVGLGVVSSIRLDTKTATDTQKGLYTLRPRAMLAVTCLLLFIALVAVLLINIFELFTSVDKREKKEAHVV